MTRLADFCIRRRRFVVGGWILLLLAVVALGAAKPAVYSNAFSIPGTESQAAVDALETGFPSRAGDSAQIVVAVDRGSVRDPRVRARVQPMLREVAAIPHVVRVSGPYGPRGAGQVSRDGRIAFATVDFDQQAQTLPKADARKVIDTAQAAAGDGLRVELGGQAIEQAARQGPPATEAVGLLAAILILLATFGSVVAMGLPILAALFGLGVGLSLLGLLTRVIDTADFAPQLAAMIGLGVGIDYALFIVSRFRDAYAEGDGDLRGAVLTSMNTAGRSVLFAGLTVVIAILGLILIGISFLYGVAVATSLVVLVTMVAALTLTPALLGSPKIGGRIGARRVGRRGADREGAVWARWSDAVVRRRWLCAIGGTLLLVALTIPAFGMRQLHNDAGNDAPGQTTRKAYDLLAKGFGPGFNGPLQIVVQRPAGLSRAQLREVATGVAAARGVARVEPARRGPDGTTGLIVTYPATSPQDTATADLVGRLRDDVAPALQRQTGTRVLVGGVPAASLDLAHLFSSKLVLFIAVVVLLSALLLTVVFRSLLVPVKAALMNLLSIGAALGVVTLVFQEGWGASLLGIEPGPIEPFLPVMMFAIIFGLSMDYEVFIVSRIREEFVATGDPRGAVRTGLAATGRVVTAAAAIMISVFGSFMIGAEDRTIMMFGLGLATAVFLDAFLIRVILLPAVMDIASHATWWLPSWLDRGMPHIGVEGPAPEPAAQASSR